MELNMENIIGTPQKKFNKLYENMMNNYNEKTAKELIDFVKVQPISFSIDNFDKLFKETYYGTDWLKNNLVESHLNMCLFLPYITLSKVHIKQYMDIHSTKLTEEQIKQLSDLYESIENTIKDHKNFIKLLDHASYCYIKNDDNELSPYDEFLLSLRSDIHNTNIFGIKDDDAIMSTIKFVYPIIIGTESDHYRVFKDIYGNLIKRMEVETEFGVCVSTLVSIILSDERMIKNYIGYEPGDLYNLRKGRFGNPDHTINYTYSGLISKVLSFQHGDMESYLTSLTTDKCKSDDVTCRDREYAINSMLIDELSVNDDNDVVAEKAFIESELERIYDFYVEFAYDISNIFYEDEDEYTTEAAPNKKEPISKKIQHKAMDIEAKQMKRKAKATEVKDNLKGAAVALSNIPKNFIDSTQAIVDKLDKMDDNRRKNFLIKPGFRKHMFKNLKLALLYGTAAHRKVSLIPVVMICRHFSKEKDKRIRNELERELETEIKVTDEKIADANSAGDQKEKYRLMRTKEQLSAELDRVKYNSSQI